MGSIDIRTKLYQMFILGLEGEKYDYALKSGLGGIILFSNDIKSAKQLISLTQELKSQALIAPFISIDQEGGRVERTENIHGGKKYLSAKYAYERGEDFLKIQTASIAKELVSYGINLNFAPCVDVNTNPNNPIIGERAFSNNTEDVIKGEQIVSQTYRDNGIIPCVKHFPGHGDANADSHLTLPKIDMPFEDLEKYHIAPFRAAIKNGIEMIMVAHLNVPCFCEEGIPTSLSENAIKYLRDNLGFKGVIISDDMVMKGVADFGEVEACVMGIKAGLNMFIYRYSDEKTVNIIETVAKIAESDVKLKENIEKSYQLILKLKQEKKIL